MISKLIAEMAREISTLMKRLLLLSRCTVDNAYTTTKEIPTITIVARIVKQIRKNFCVLVSPKLPQFTSYGSGGRSIFMSSYIMLSRSTTEK